MIIAIDTSTETAGIALVREGEALAELTWRCGQNHTTQLLPSLAELMARTKTGIRDARGVVVARGPGSFNGLRVGMSTAKGLALALDIPLVGVSTLEAEAFQHAETGLPTCPINNAGRGELAVAMYQQRGGEWLQLMDERITTLDELYGRITGETVFCGELAARIAAGLRQRLGKNAVIPPRAALVRRALYLAELGSRRLAAGEADNLATLQPLYLRRPSITQPRQPFRSTAGGSKDG